MKAKEYPAMLNTVIDDLINREIINIKDTLLIDERIFIDTLNGYTYGPVNLNFWHTYLKDSTESHNLKLNKEDRLFYKQIQKYRDLVVLHNQEFKYDANIKFIKRDNISDLIKKTNKKVIYFSPLIRRSSDLYVLWVGFHRDQDPPGYCIYLKKFKNKYNIVSVMYPDFDPIYMYDYIKDAKF